MTDHKPMQSFIVLGGGTAGYLSALYLKKVFQVEVSLIESPTIPTIGAGEASIPTMLAFFKSLDIDEKAFLKQTSATFKCGIEYHYWKHPSKKGAIYHPFYSDIDLPPFFLEDYFAKKEKGLCSSLAFEAYPFLKAIHEGVAPKNFEDPDYQWQLPYAYHFDNQKLASFLKKLALERGIKHFEANVDGVSFDEKGHIKALYIPSIGNLEADFFIDCSGFNAYLIQKHLKSPRHCLKPYILNDRALAIKLPHVGDERLSYTTVRGMKSGWLWQIPLQDCMGYGYVHASDFISQNQAHDEMQALLGFKEGSAQLIHMQNYYLEKMWIGNCLSVGLSAGFIEPLESTGLFLITHALELLYKYPPSLQHLNKQSQLFNQEMKGLYDRILAFICLHYQYNTRKDSPFWQAQANTLKPPYLQELIQRFQEHYGRLQVDLDAYSPFHDFSYALFLDAFGIFPKNTCATLPHRPSLQSFKKQQEKRLDTLKKGPSHKDFLRQL